MLMNKYNFYLEFDGLKSIPVDKNFVSYTVVANDVNEAIQKIKNKFKNSSINVVDHLSSNEIRVFLDIHRFIRKPRQVILYGIKENKPYEI